MYIYKLYMILKDAECKKRKKAMRIYYLFISPRLYNRQIASSGGDASNHVTDQVNREHPRSRGRFAPAWVYCSSIARLFAPVVSRSILSCVHAVYRDPLPQINRENDRDVNFAARPHGVFFSLFSFARR